MIKRVGRGSGRMHLLHEDYLDMRGDWCESWPGEKIRVRAYWDLNRKFGRVAVQGQGSPVMERDFVSRKSMLEIAKGLPSAISYDDLKVLGFREG